MITERDPIDFAHLLANRNQSTYCLTCFRQMIGGIELSLPVLWGLKTLADPDYWGCSKALLICYGRKPALLGWVMNQKSFEQLCREWAKYTNFESLVVVATGVDEWNHATNYYAHVVCDGTNERNRTIDYGIFQEV